jgi:hypothetical protein
LSSICLIDRSIDKNKWISRVARHIIASEVKDLLCVALIK